MQIVLSCSRSVVTSRLPVFSWKTIAKNATRGYLNMRQISVGWSTNQRKFCSVLGELEVSRLRDGNSIRVHASPRVFLALSWMINRRWKKMNHEEQLRKQLKRFAPRASTCVRGTVQLLERCQIYLIIAVVHLDINICSSTAHGMVLYFSKI